MNDNDKKLYEELLPIRAALEDLKKRLHALRQDIDNLKTIKESLEGLQTQVVLSSDALEQNPTCTANLIDECEDLFEELSLQRKPLEEKEQKLKESLMERCTHSERVFSRYCYHRNESFHRCVVCDDEL